MAIISNNQIKYLKSLSQKKFREKYGHFIAEGEKIVKEACKSDFKVINTFRLDEIGEDCMKKISCFNTPSPILAVIEQKKYSLNEINFKELFLKKDDSLFLALCGIRDPGNLGTIIRIADWFGIDAIFCSEDTVDIYNPKVVQATMGAIFRKIIIYTNIKEVIDIFNSNNKPIYGTFLDGNNMYTQSIKKEGLIIMGNESNGIPDDIGKLINNRLYIPSYNNSSITGNNSSITSESLNVAIATAIVCAEFRRK